MGIFDSLIVSYRGGVITHFEGPHNISSACDPPALLQLVMTQALRPRSSGVGLAFGSAWPGLSVSGVARGAKASADP